MYLRTTFTALALALSGSAMAAPTGPTGPSWTYVDLGVVASSAANSDNSYTGFDLAGSFELGSLWHLQAAVSSAEADLVNNTGDPANKATDEVTSYELRVGVHPAITENVDVVFDVGYSGSESKVTSATTGVGRKINPSFVDIRVGTRVMIGTKFELNGFLAVAQGNDDNKGGVYGDEDFTAFIPSIGAQYFFTDAISLSIDYSIATAETSHNLEEIGGGTIVVDSDLQSDHAKIGVRWNF